MSNAVMFTSLFIAGGIVGGVLVLCGARHTTASMGRRMHPQWPKILRLPNHGQRRIRRNARQDFVEAMEMLRQEERRQRPEEQRN